MRIRCARSSDCPVFERLTLSAEDQQRGTIYHAQRERAQLEQNVQTREDFFRSLEQEAEIAPLTPGNAGPRSRNLPKNQPVQPDHAPATRSSNCPIWPLSRDWNCFPSACAIGSATTAW